MRSGTTVTALIVAVEGESTWWAFLPLRPPAPGWKECEGRYLWPADVLERAQLEAAAQPLTAGERGFVVRGPKEVVPRGAVLLEGVPLRCRNGGDPSDLVIMPEGVVTSADTAFAALSPPSFDTTAQKAAAGSGTRSGTFQAPTLPDTSSASPVLHASSFPPVPKGATVNERPPADTPPARKLVRTEEEGRARSKTPPLNGGFDDELPFELVSMTTAENDLQRAARAVRWGTLEDIKDALVLYDRAINSASAKFGPAHINIAPMLHRKALALTQFARKARAFIGAEFTTTLKEAVSLFDLALDIAARDEGDDSAKAVAYTLSKARTLGFLGDAESLNGAMQLLDRVHAIKAKALGDDHIEVVRVLVEKATALTMLPQDARRANLRQALPLFEQAIAALDAKRVSSLQELEFLQSTLKQKAQALRCLRDVVSQRAAVAVYDRLIGMASPADDAAAMPLIREKLDLLEDIGGSEELNTALLLYDRVLAFAQSNWQTLVAQYTRRREFLTKRIARESLKPGLTQLSAHVSQRK
jgi:tetratricopeptide (TPR) repeat protein